MGDVVTLDVVTSLPIDPARVLTAASKITFERVLVIGFTAEGEEYFAASDPDGGTTLWDMERCKFALMKIADE